MRTAFAIAMCLLATSVAAPAHAFRTAGDLASFQSERPIGWAHSDVITFELAGELPEGVDELGFDRAFDRATDTWATINCLGPTPLLTWIARGEHEAADGINTVGFVDANELPAGVADETPAVTELQYERDEAGQWRIIEADIYLNASRNWADGASFDVDLPTVLAHEIGHVVGLLHPCEPSDDEAPACDESHEAELMFPLYYAEGTSLGEDDEQGYCFLYPEPRCDPRERGCVIEPDVSCDAGDCDASVGDGGAEDAAVPAGGGDYACASDAGDAGCELSFASPCTSGDQCASGLCIGDTASSSTCTRNCGGDDGPCPSGFSCEAVGGENVCVGPEPESGCAVLRPSPGRGAPLAPWLFLGAFALVFRSARLRRCSSHKN